VETDFFRGKQRFGPRVSFLLNCENVVMTRVGGFFFAWLGLFIPTGCGFSPSEETEPGINPMLPELVGNPIQYSTIDVGWTQVEPGDVTLTLASNEDCSDVLETQTVSAQTQVAVFQPATAGDYFVCARHSRGDVEFQNVLALSLRKGWYRFDVAATYPDLVGMSDTMPVVVGNSMFILRIRTNNEYRYALELHLPTDTWTVLDLYERGMPTTGNFTPVTDGATLWMVGNRGRTGEVYTYDGERFTLTATTAVGYPLVVAGPALQYIGGTAWASSQNPGGVLFNNPTGELSALDIGSFKLKTILTPRTPEWDVYLGEWLSSHCIVSDADRHIMLSGYSRGAIPHRNMRIFTPATGVTTVIPGTGPGPNGRAHPACGIRDNQIYMFGGDTNNANMQNDLWVYDFPSGVWSQMPANDPNYPAIRSHASMVMLPKGFAIIGGWASNTPTYRDAHFYYP
jgi:hypothetical protein